MNHHPTIKPTAAAPLHVANVYAAIVVLQEADAEKQPPTHGATITLDGLSADVTQRIIRACAEGIGISGRGTNGRPGGSTVTDDPLGGFSVHLAVGSARVTLGVIGATRIQRDVIESMIRLLSCGWCGAPLAWVDYEHGAGELCRECHDHLWEGPDAD